MSTDNNTQVAEQTKAQKLAKTRTKQELVTLAEKWGVTHKGVAKDALAEALVAEADARRGKSATLARYRDGYGKVTAYSGKPSLSNGDATAQFLQGKSPTEVMAKAEELLGLGKDFLAKLYQERNPGAKRMNSGNRIRAALVRGDLTQEQLVW